jgi:glycosyltransferase involved in cell wall biosynthesis
VPFLIDQERIASLADSERREGVMRRRLGIRAKYVILFVGRLIPLKGVADLLEAFLAAHEDLPEVDLLICGDGPLRDPLCRRAGDLLGKRIHVPGFMQPDDVARCFGIANVSVVPSTRDAWGLVVNEAMAAGVPVVSTSCVGAAADLVVDCRTGRLIPRGNAGRLAEVLRESFAHPSKLAEMGQLARKKLSQWYSRCDPIRHFDDAVRKALRGHCLGAGSQAAGRSC